MPPNPPNTVYLAPNCRWVVNSLEDSPIEPLKALNFLNLFSDLSGFQRSQWFSLSCPPHRTFGGRGNLPEYDLFGSHFR
jgi:hypothetical protein